MKIGEFLKDKIIVIFLFIMLIIFTFLLLLAFSVHIVLLIYIPSLMIITGLLILAYEFLRRNKFYNTINKILKDLDQKYLITEIINEPSFIDGKLLMEYLYEINKSMNEHVKQYKSSSENFKEYMELWCHEIKTPIATSKMVLENNKSTISESVSEELNKIDNYVEQILYYARSETVEKDYFIKQIDLKQVIDNVIKRNKKDLISKKIKIELSNLETKINSDSKWLEFIINQIITNSIKYSKEENSTLNIYTKLNKDNIYLMIEDNGIGIINSELERVFDKGFTGTNGRKKYNSTGIGLYLCQKLCLKLGHNINIESIINEKTIVTITFPIGSLTNDIIK